MGLLLKSKIATTPDYYIQKAKVEKELGRELSNKEFEDNYLQNRGGINIE